MYSLSWDALSPNAFNNWGQMVEKVSSFAFTHPLNSQIKKKNFLVFFIFHGQWKWWIINEKELKKNSIKEFTKGIDTGLLHNPSYPMLMRCEPNNTSPIKLHSICSFYLFTNFFFISTWQTTSRTAGATTSSPSESSRDECIALFATHLISK